MKNKLLKAAPVLLQRAGVALAFPLLICLLLIQPFQAAATTSEGPDLIESEADITITGTVLDENEEALPGATVSVQGTTRGTVTDLDGKFSITVPEESTLVISFIGYQAQTIKVSNQSELTIRLSQDASALEEVVVIGYGTQRKSDLTGSVGSVGETELSERPAP